MTDLKDTQFVDKSGQVWNRYHFTNSDGSGICTMSHKDPAFFNPESPGWKGIFLDWCRQQLDERFGKFEYKVKTIDSKTLYTKMTTDQVRQYLWEHYCQDQLHYLWEEKRQEMVASGETLVVFLRTLGFVLEEEIEV